MRVHYLQHVPFEGLGSIESWLRQKDCRITCTRLHESTDFPETSEYDLLIIMGGPMSVNDESKHEWLVQEKQFIRTAVTAGKHVLGICLGAQLIANSLGVSVYRSEHKEIGWFPINGTPSSDGSAFRFPNELEVFHWHGETFELPADAVRLAKSEGCDNQAFQLGQNVIGLQFHLEITPESAAAIVFNCREELIPSRYVQKESTILAAAPDKYETVNAMMGCVLTYLQERR